MHAPADAAKILRHPAVCRVTDALAAHQVPGQVRVLAGEARTAAQAADYLGVSVSQIANSLVFVARRAPRSAPAPLLVLTSGGHRVDTVKVADLLELTSLEKADPAFVNWCTGFAVGGVAPVGHSRPVPAVVDVSLARHAVIWAAAGHSRAVFPTRYDELLRISAGHSLEVT